jgi:hypothetical protein
VSFLICILRRTLHHQTLTLHSQVPVALILEPFINLLSCTSNSVTYSRLIDAVFDPVIGALTPVEVRDQPLRKKRRTETEDPAEENSHPFLLNAAVDGNTPPRHDPLQVRKSITRALLSRASKPEDPSVKDANRRKIYTYVRERDEDDDEDDDQ